MPLQNRVDPFAELFASQARGTMFGNRGGRFHTDARTLTKRRHVSRAWICCVLEFKDRGRDVWGRSYTELFFLDEVTALASGHRPCFECRRKDAVRFAELWGNAGKLKSRPRAGAMDEVLHRERLDGRAKRRHRRAIDQLPDGAVIAMKGGAFAVRGRALLQWTPSGYAERKRRPRGGTVEVLTPPAILEVLAIGYQPRWHTSAERRVDHLTAKGA
ncbi:MAG: hypothetical protein K2Y71_00295 [Xanthobacteraceae bacterium]|nr:hypothetical protein [Xanthobacteraceae bacterium]